MAIPAELLDPTGDPLPGTTWCPCDLRLCRGGGSLIPFQWPHRYEGTGVSISKTTITKGNWAFNLGLRGDIYNGLVTHKEAEPRLGVAYNIKKTNTILRTSYARVLETPFNENLMLSSIGMRESCSESASGLL